MDINLSQKSDLKVSFDYSNICLTDLMDELTELYNIGFTKSATGYNMHIDKVRTQFFDLNYHNFSRKTTSSTIIQSNSPPSSSSSSDSSSSESDSSSSTTTPSQSTNSTTITTALDDNFWSNVGTTLTTLVGSGPECNFSMNKETGVIIVNSYPRNLKHIERFLRLINTSSHAQIIIEAKILEINLRDEFSSGIDWSMLQGTFSKVTPDLINSVGSPASTFIIKAQGKKYFEATLQALSSQGKLSVLASPRVSVLNNQRAIIKFGIDEYHLTSISSNIQTGSGSSGNVSNASIGLNPIFSGIALDTTPNIIEPNEVILHIHPVITTVTDINKTFEMSDGNVTKLPLPSIQTREADTIVKASSGDVVIIGGLMYNTVSVNSTGPTSSNSWLNKLFGIFSSKSKTNARSELVILLRPTIVTSYKEVIDREFERDDLQKYLIDEE